MGTMTSRQRLRTIISGQPADRCGFWLGMPHVDSWPAYHRYFGTTTQEEVRAKLGDEFRWICPEWSAYGHPQGQPMWHNPRASHDLSSPGVFAECESVQQVHDHPWPNPDYLDFTVAVDALANAGDVYRASAMWCCFFHIVADFFGMENYFVRMYTHPEIVHAVTTHVVDFYREANRRFYAQAGTQADGAFFGNDFGSQLDLLISPQQAGEFILPYYAGLITDARTAGYQVLLHSCGSIHRVIPSLIDLGVSALHPLQAKASCMDAATLSRDFKGRLAFIGAIDTQDLLINATPEQVKAEVRRVKALLGPAYIVSPSHECLLPNVPAANVEAMAQAARE